MKVKTIVYEKTDKGIFIKEVTTTVPDPVDTHLVKLKAIEAKVKLIYNKVTEVV
ncbi:MAG: hypothetical protein KAU20_05865 [Nanoarchaeota archaeon]|nr:hypothetical protein [Nanoarchaeota archaeon]